MSLRMPTIGWRNCDRQVRECVIPPTQRAPILVSKKIVIIGSSLRMNTLNDVLLEENNQLVTVLISSRHTVLSMTASLIVFCPLLDVEMEVWKSCMVEQGMLTLSILRIIIFLTSQSLYSPQSFSVKFFLFFFFFSEA